MSKDAVEATDQVESGTIDATTPPAFPCEDCGRETLEHTDGERICAMPLCRKVQPG